MKTRMLVLTVLAFLGLLVTGSTMAAGLDCKLHFDLSSWSVFYKHASGQGVVTCTNGQSMKVKIRANGGGLALGKAEVKDGVGNFTDLSSITDVLGTYAQADANTGIVKNGDAQMLTKGDVSLVLAGAGKGFGMGVTVGAFTIEKSK